MSRDPARRHRWPQRGDVVCDVLLLRHERLGAGGSDCGPRDPGRGRGAAADDVAGLRSRRRGRAEHGQGAGQPQRRRLCGCPGGRARLAVRAAAAGRSDTRRGPDRNGEPGRRGDRGRLPAAPADEPGSPARGDRGAAGGRSAARGAARWFRRHRGDGQAAALRGSGGRRRSVGLPADRGDRTGRRRAPVPGRGPAVLQPRRTPLHRDAGPPGAPCATLGCT